MEKIKYEEPIVKITCFATDMLTSSPFDGPEVPLTRSDL